jgi:secreted trypsin-like serine protease
LFEDSYEQGRRPDWFQSLMDSSYCDHIVVQECQDQSSGTVPDSGSNPDPEPSRPNAGQQARAGSCGKPQVSPARNRIVGGMEARAHSIPWIVSMRKYGSFHFCGGTLIRVNDQRDESDIVITAAHCVDKSSTNPQIDIVAGAHKKTSKADGEQSVPAAQVVVHPRYGAGGATNNNDIAIIKLSRPIKFSRTIQPACLPSPNEKIADGTSGTVAGWGTLQEGGRTPDTLQQVSIPTISYQKCASQYGSSRINEQTQFCGGFDQGGKDSCQGDSGGPYFFQGRNGAVLQGVVSWGAGCARARYAGVYARVANYLDWIQQNVNSLSSIRG